MKSKQTSWGNVAAWYDESLENHSDTYHAQIILPNLLRLLDDTAGSDATDTIDGKTDKNVNAGKIILDLACGQGFFAREIARSIANSKVIGADISSELITRAKNNPDPISKQISYYVSEATDLSFLKDRSIDAILISLAIQNIEHAGDVFKECTRVLTVSGKLILIMNHPAFRIPKHSSWQWDETDSKKPVEYRRIDGYMTEFSEKIDMKPGASAVQNTELPRHSNQAAQKFTISFHRPLQFYFKALAKAGFAVSRLEEWISHKKSQPGARSAEENRMRKEIPLFLMIEAEKN